MKRILMAAVGVCLLTVSQMMGQTPTTMTATPKAKAATNATAKPATKPAPKYVFYGDGTGTWQGGEGQAHAATPDNGKHWPSPSYETPGSAGQRPETELASQAAGNAGSPGSNHVLRCIGPEKRPCTEWNVRELCRRMVEKRGEHPALARVRRLGLESSDGTLSCRQENGEHCTWEQMRSLNEHVAEPLRCAIYFGQTTSTARSSNAMQTPAGTRLASGATWQGGASTTPANSTYTPSGSYATPTATGYVPYNATTATGRNSSTQNHNSTTQNHVSAAGARATVSQNQATTALHHRPAPQKHD